MNGQNVVCLLEFIDKLGLIDDSQDIEIPVPRSRRDENRSLTGDRSAPAVTDLGGRCSVHRPLLARPVTGDR